MYVNMDTWKAVLVFVAFVVVFNAVPAALAMPYTRTLKSMLEYTPSAPPPVAFAVIWPVLYTLLAGAAFAIVCVDGQDGVSQTATASRSAWTKWTALGLVLAQLALNWAWTPVFAQGKQSAATLLVVGMLALTLPAIALTAGTQPLTAALLSPYAAWLVFALLLSAQSQAARRQ